MFSFSPDSDFILRSLPHRFGLRATSSSASHRAIFPSSILTPYDLFLIDSDPLRPLPPDQSIPNDTRGSTLPTVTTADPHLTSDQLLEMGQRMPQPTPPSSNTTPESEVRDQNDGRPETFSKLHLELIFKNLKIAEIEPEVSKFIGGDLVIKPYEIDEPYEMYGFHCNHRWYHTDEYADPTAFVPDLPKAEHLQGSNMFEKLRRLRIAIKEFQMSLLPRLACPNLSHLEIDHLSFDLNEPMTLQLSELEVLHVRQLSGCLTTNRLTFDSAKLSVLCLGEFRLSLVTLDL